MRFYEDGLTRVVLGISLCALALSKASLALHEGAADQLVIDGSLIAIAAVVEFTLGAAVLVRPGRTTRIAVFGFAGILLAVTVAMLWSGLDLARCGCFGAARLGPAQHVGAVLCLLALSGMWLFTGQERAAGTSSLVQEQRGENP